MNDMILILSDSQEYSQEIAQRLRAEQICAQIMPASASAKEVAMRDARGVLLCGAMETNGGVLDAGITRLGIPVLAIGQAAYALLAALGGAQADVAIEEKRAQITYGKSALFTGVSDGERYFAQARTLMLPPDVEETACAAGCTIAFEDKAHRQYGVQFDMERNDLDGAAVLTNFVLDICGCSRIWTLDMALEQAEGVLRQAAARGGHAICAVSGGVDSMLCALLAHRIFGGQMTAIFVDTGLMREGEVEDICLSMRELGIPTLCVDRSAEILHDLMGQCSMEEKRDVVVKCLYEEMLAQSAAIEGEKILVLGTNYVDFLESGSSAPQWRESGMTIAEPLMALFKDEVRAIGKMLGMSEALVNRKPFPALGLGARIVGEVTPQRLQALRTAERIFREEIQESGMERKLYKHFPVLIGGEPFGMEMMVLRAVTLSGGQLTPARLPYDLVERTVAKLQSELPGIARVLYDQTPTGIGQETFY